uniref:Uncharacterized protein n=1 Tax=Leersia perrieri TaxID=77586 RepID=A0A0D9WEV7_9ORYZ
MAFDSFFMLVCWRIWKERNARTFQQMCKTAEALVAEIKEEAALWSSADRDRQGVKAAHAKPEGRRRGWKAAAAVTGEVGSGDGGRGSGAEKAPSREGWGGREGGGRCVYSIGRLRGDDGCV